MMYSFGKIKHINVFSDDLAWCMEQFKGSKFSFHSHDNPVVDLAKMAAHQRIIIANSSFSWWAAWMMARRTGGYIIAPRPWFANDTAASDLLLPTWITLDARS